MRFGIEAIADEHIFGVRDLGSVENNGRQRIQTIAHQLDVLVLQQFGLNRKAQIVNPVALLDPLDFQFVRAPERVGN